MPVAMPEPHPSRARRRFLEGFLRTSVGALLVSVFYPVIRFLAPPKQAEPITQQVVAGMTNDPELLDHGYKIVVLGNEPVLLVRVASDDYRAFAATCTHLDCIVEYRKAQRDIHCNCHDGVYDLQGRVVAGPPPRPLASFQVDLVARGAGQAREIVVSRA